VYLVADAGPDVSLEPNAGMSVSWTVTFRGASGALVSPALLVIGPDATDLTFTRTGTATYTEHT
jgi:hypothetical protein